MGHPLNTDPLANKSPPFLKQESKHQTVFDSIKRLFRGLFFRPDYLPEEFVSLAVRPLLTIYLAGTAFSLIVQDWRVMSLLILMSTGISLALFKADNKSLYWLIPVSTSILPCLLIVYSISFTSLVFGTVVDQETTIWPLVALVFLYATIHYASAALFSIIILSLLIPGVYSSFGFMTAIRVLIVFGLVTWGLYHFTRTLAMQYNTKLKLSTTDDLTKLPNRRALNASLFHWQQFKQRYPETNITLAILDLDYFKKINDQLGHLSGDTVLHDFAVHMDQRIRTTDFFARYGGEEFALILPNTTADQANNIIDDLRERISKMMFLQDAHITFSAGIAELGQTDSVDNWIARADTALYAAKNAGRNCNRLG